VLLVQGLEAGYAIARRGIVHVPEGRQVFLSLTVAECLMAAASGRGAAEADA
jgi:ABC-type branched-subunit amino acid transport system ATPase component